MTGSFRRAAGAGRWQLQDRKSPDACGLGIARGGRGRREGDRQEYDAVAHALPLERAPLMPNALAKLQGQEGKIPNDSFVISTGATTDRMQAPVSFSVR